MDKPSLKQKLISLLSKVSLVLSRAWKVLDGWKATIGLLALYIESKYDLPDKWYIDWGLISIYIWTGVGIGHKVKKQLGKQNVTENSIEETLRNISRIRELNDKLRDRGR